MKQQILLQRLTISCIVGLLPFEREIEQRLEIDLIMDVDFRYSGQNDTLGSDTVNYAEVADLLNNWLREQKFQTLEALVWQSAIMLMSKYTVVQHISLQAIKPTILPQCTQVGLRLEINRNELSI